MCLKAIIAVASSFGADEPIRHLYNDETPVAYLGSIFRDERVTNPSFVKQTDPIGNFFHAIITTTSALSGDPGSLGRVDMELAVSRLIDTLPVGKLFGTSASPRAADLYVNLGNFSQFKSDESVSRYIKLMGTLTHNGPESVTLELRKLEVPVLINLLSQTERMINVPTIRNNPHRGIHEQIGLLTMFQLELKAKVDLLNAALADRMSNQVGV